MNRDILVSANPDTPGKLPLKRKDCCGYMHILPTYRIDLKSVSICLFIVLILDVHCYTVLPPAGVLRIAAVRRYISQSVGPFRPQKSRREGYRNNRNSMQIFSSVHVTVCTIFPTEWTKFDFEFRFRIGSALLLTSV